MPDLVRVTIGKVEKTVGATFAESKGLDVLKDEPTTRPDGRPRETTRTGGRRMKARTTVKKAAAKKAAAKKAAQEIKTGDAGKLTKDVESNKS